MLYSSFWDLILVALPRIGAAGYAIAWGYLRPRIRPSRHQTMFHKDGTKKSRAELEDEAIDEPCTVVCSRYLFRLPFFCELLVAATAVLVAAKCLSRLNVEIGVYGEAHPQHPLFWIALGLITACSVLEGWFVDQAHTAAEQLGRNRGQNSFGEPLNGDSTPLLQGARGPVEYMAVGDDDGTMDNESDEEDYDGSVEGDEWEESRNDSKESDSQQDEWDEQGAAQNATISDLLRICAPDKTLIVATFLCMFVAGLANVCIPKLTGAVVDSLIHPDADSHASETMTYEAGSDSESISNSSDFVRTIQLLVAASLVGGFFGGAREVLSEVRFACVAIAPVIA
jgi:hypothetical protein